MNTWCFVTDTYSKVRLSEQRTPARISVDKPLIIGDVEIPCYVLEDWTRVLTQTGLIRGLWISTGSTRTGNDRLTSFATQERIKPYLGANTIDMIAKPIKAIVWGTNAYVYEATVLSDICDAIVQAKEQGKLMKQQEHIWIQALKLLRGFAKVGIIALVDEVTWYQDIRKRSELQTILDAYLQDEFAPWTKKFPDAYYKNLLRLWLWDYDPKLLKRKPSFVWTITNKIVYNKLPTWVLEELRRKTPRSEAGNTLVRFHQFLTEDIGNPHLQTQLVEVITLMKISKSKEQFLRHFAQAFPEPDVPKNQELWLELDEEEKLPK